MANRTQRKKSADDIRKQAKRLIYAHPRATGARQDLIDEIEHRYLRNIAKTKSFMDEVNRQNGWYTEDSKRQYRKYSRSTYMGLNES